LDVPGNERFGLFGAFRAQISQSCQFEFVQLFLHQQTGVQEERKNKKVREKLGIKSLIHSGKNKTNQTFKSINLRMAAIVSRFLNLLKR
jgi:hypothetical protein